MSIKRHPREMKIAEAESEFSALFLALESKYELTYGEMFELLSKRIARLAGNLISDERGK